MLSTVCFFVQHNIAYRTKVLIFHTEIVYITYWTQKHIMWFDNAGMIEDIGFMSVIFYFEKKMIWFVLYQPVKKRQVTHNVWPFNVIVRSDIVLDEAGDFKPEIHCHLVTGSLICISSESVQTPLQTIRLSIRSHAHTHVMERQDQEGPSPGTLSDDCQEPWVDGAEVVVLDAACDWHAIIAAILGGGLTKHVAEFGVAVLRTPCHLTKGREVEEEGRSVKENHPSCKVNSAGDFCRW